MLTPAAIVTGAAGGLGYAVAVGLARAGKRVIMTGRDAARGAAALARLRQDVNGADAAFALLDLAELAAIARFAETAAGFGPIGILVNNAGVMALPRRRTTTDGFELQFGTNHLGHFALTGRLLPLLLQQPGARVVTVSSLAHRKGRIDFADLNGERQYSPWEAYRQSKLANLIFARHLQRRAAEAGWDLRSIAAHPGWSATSIVLNGVGEKQYGLASRVMQTGFNLLAQSADGGARPILFAALSKQAEGGQYYGPGGPGEIRGAPSPARVFPQAEDLDTAVRLWTISETATKVTYLR